MTADSTLGDLRLSVRAARDSDEAAIHAVHAASFPTEAEANLVDQLRASGRLTLSLVMAPTDAPKGPVVGHVAFSPTTADGSDEIGWGLAPVAVLEEQRGQGLAAALIRSGLKQAEAMRMAYVVVLGDPAYYGRFGFVAASQRGLTCSWDAGDAFQVLTLDDARAPRDAAIRYAPELEAL